MISSIPAWNNQGVIPPVDPNDPTSADRSPYVVSLAEVVRRFATSPERIAILRGFLEYRAALHAVDLKNGFQWLDGSFLENKEVLRGESPGDIDVVTFYRLPQGVTQREVFARNPFLFDEDQHDERKEQYRVDAFLESLTMRPEALLWQSNYWYGMWSHQRETFSWKGFLQVALSSDEDAFVLAALPALSGGATP